MNNKIREWLEMRNNLNQMIKMNHMMIQENNKTIKMINKLIRKNKTIQIRVKIAKYIEKVLSTNSLTKENGNGLNL